MTTRTRFAAGHFRPGRGWTTTERDQTMQKTRRFVVIRGDQIVSDHPTLDKAETARAEARADRVRIAEDCPGGCGALVPFGSACSCLRY